VIYIDIETRSDADIRECGVYRYAEDPSTRILCLAYADEDGPIGLVAGHDKCLDFVREAVAYEHKLAAHNADFERLVIGQWFKINVEHWLDTAACAAERSLPRKLEDLALALFPDKPEYHKDMAGNRTMLKLCKRNRRGEFWTPEDLPKDFAKLYAYCKKDVEVMRACHKKLGDQNLLPVRWLTADMNDQGWCVDVASLGPAQEFLDRHTERYTAWFEELVGMSPKSPNLAAHFGLEDVTKYTVRNALRDLKHAAHHEALSLRQKLASSSTTKIDRFRNRVSADGRLRGAFMYCGAERTGRFSSVGVQLQNFNRGMGKSTDTAFAALHADVLEQVFDGSPRDAPMPPLDPLSTVAEMLRGFLVGDPGLLVGDFAQIEARVNAWLAGQDDLLEVFATGGDPYCRQASKIYGREITKADKAERFMGKQVILGCGYAMGHKRFRSMLDEIYDVQVDESFAKQAVDSYRQANPKIVALWNTLVRGFEAVITGKMKKAKVGPVFMGTVMESGEQWAWVELPSKRKLWYFHPHVKDGRIRYYGRDIYRGGKWGTVDTHGGKITENIVQATSRDIMVEAMMRLRGEGFRLVGTVHDEVIAEGAKADLEKFKTCMAETPSWARGLPIEVDTFWSRRYRK
jgi:DNA polymerase